GSLSSDNQRILAAVGKLTDGLRNNNGTVDPLCGSEWTHNGLNCYYLSRYARPWNYAKKHCEDKKAHLMVINGLEEMNFLRNISQSQSLWFGLSTEKGIWKWVDSTSYERSPKFWKEGYPYPWYRHGEWCGLLEYGEGWRSLPCSQSYQYICEKKTL
ncbi:unnamed protein product, partial [Staurois parvus]